MEVGRITQYNMANRQPPLEHDQLLIIVGAYPELSGLVGNESQLKLLRRAVDLVVPADVALHLLPPYPSSGDYGFAPNDWFSVRPSLGLWGDVVALAATRKLILDGVYNHVGLLHPFAREFFLSPSENGVIYAYCCGVPPSALLSPRGGSVFRKYSIGGKVWQVWQTFSEASLDIRLSHSRIREEINRHLDFLVTSGLFGVRLDGCAYYGHDLDVEQFHNPTGRTLAQGLARLALKRGLFVIAQADADPVGASYFLKAEGWSVPVVDYAYSAVLVRALLSESASAMALHTERTSNLPCEVLRPPRTHDGILLQSDILTKSELDDLDMICNLWRLPVRSEDGEPYEINSSLPYICSLGVCEDSTWQRVVLIIVLTGFLSGIPYFYLPFVLCEIPEKWASIADKDPRSLNRSRIDIARIEKFSKSLRGTQLREALQTIYKVRIFHPEERVETVTSSSEPSVLILFRDSRRCVFACNFSTTHVATLRLPNAMRLVWGSRTANRTLGPLGFGIWSSDVAEE